MMPKNQLHRFLFSIDVQSLFLTYLIISNNSRVKVIVKVIQAVRLLRHLGLQNNWKNDYDITVIEDFK